MNKNADFPIVGIGASAGGLEALESLFRSIPADPELSFVIVTHLGSGRVSFLREILERYNALPENLKQLLTLAFDSSHYHRLWWYWGGEAAQRLNGTKLELTTIPEEEWSTVEAVAMQFWDEVAKESKTKARVIGILKQYNADMQKVGPPYRYS